MSGNIRLPNITGKTVEEQAHQMKSYLIQLAGELNWALDNIARDGASPSYAPYRSANTGSAGADAQKKSEELIQNFNDLKGLIIKSADIVNAYYDQINTRLEGVYVAESEYGDFYENTSQYIEANNKYVEQLFKSTQEIIPKQIKDVEKSLIDATAYIKSGEVDTDKNGAPVYGLEIGQRNEINKVEVFKKYARFTADRLSFFDRNGTEVAYISDRKLFISNVEITVSFKIGGFIDTVMDNKSIVTKWVGGG